ncbi:hypothetical protein TrVE_jg9883 [Triparma verrucosa]|uniref:USP domain-containing protein n=2 Tax=Triparma verrucosa TaxID=1606542 RepID=A0A9W6ZB12_9STRA|nr:hypothetical protein TrVE_jg9883 [Triparma verrucosa]
MSALTDLESVENLYKTHDYDGLLRKLTESEEYKNQMIAALEALDVPPTSALPPPPAGIVNHGNTCYLSTILVALLYASPPLLSCLLSPSFSSAKEGSQSSLVETVSELAFAPTPVDATAFFRSFVDAFDASRLGDAFNTYLKFMDLFPAADRSWLFEGTMHHAKSSSEKPFTFISLPLSSSSSLDDSLTKALADAERSIKSPPKSLLTFHLKRFTFCPTMKQKIKDTGNFSIPDTVALTEAAAYTLTSFIAHTGEAEGGHFVACVKRNDSWFHFDDENVSSLEEPKRAELLSTCSYMLFYTRPVDSSVDSDIDGGVDVGNNRPTVPLHLQAHINKRVNKYRRTQLAKSDEKFREFLVNLFALRINSVEKFQLDGNALVGRKVEVKWTSGFFRGVITKFDSELTKFHVKYEDGAEKAYKLHKKDFRFILD